MLNIIKLYRFYLDKVNIIKMLLSIKYKVTVYTRSFYISFTNMWNF